MPKPFERSSSHPCNLKQSLVLAPNHQLVDAGNKTVYFSTTVACLCQHEYDFYLLIFEHGKYCWNVVSCRRHQLKKSNGRSMHISVSTIVTITTSHSNVDCHAGGSS